MLVKTIVDEDFTNYRKPSMVIGMPRCSFKCDRECGQQVCQNMPLATAPDITIDDDDIIHRYLNNSLTQAVCIMGLEPWDTPDQLLNFIFKFRQYSQDDIVIYTGYTKAEIKEQVEQLAMYYQNIIIKFGRYIPGQQPHRDEVLGVDLASDNQYAERIS